jgi:hypothetical protein
MKVVIKIIEGTQGPGDKFMTGAAPLPNLPAKVVSAVRHILNQTSRNLGPIKIEWVYDWKYCLDSSTS